MDPVWKLLCDGTEKPLAEWGIESAAVTTGNQVPDTLTLGMGADYKGASIFPYGATVELFRDQDGERRREFVGRITQVPRSASGGQYSTSYEAAGPWWYLQNKVYREFWAVAGEYKSRAVLTYDEEDTKMSAADTLAAAVNYVVGKGAPIAVGNLAAITGNIPSEEVENLTCAEVLTRVLRWYPDAVVWFDYNTEGYPTLNISRAASAAVEDFSLGTRVVERLNYISRDDVRKDGVSIQYERIDSSDGNQTEVVTSDTAGDVSGFNVLEATVSLIGAQVSWAKQYLKAETINIDSKQWLRDHIPELAGVDLDKITIVSSSLERDDASITKEVIDGAHADWMGGESGTVKVSATLEYEVDDIKEQGTFALELRGTSKSTGTFATVSSETPSEPTPVGLAQQMYDALNRDHWEGSFTVVDQVAGRWDLVGKAVRLTDRGGALLFGPAQVQGVTVDLATGSTTVDFGPTPILSAGDLVALLRSARGRIAASTRLKTGGDSNPATAPGEKTANNNSGQRPTRKHTILTGGGGVTITVDLATPPAGVTSNLDIQLRPFPVCDPETGEDKVVWGPFSEMVDP